MEDHDLILRLDAKMDLVIEQMKQIKDIEERLRSVEQDNREKNERVETIKCEVDKLRNTNTIWSFFNSIAVVVGTILGITR